MYGTTISEEVARVHAGKHEVRAESNYYRQRIGTGSNKQWVKVCVSLCLTSVLSSRSALPSLGFV